MDGLTATDIVVRFGGLVALDHVDLEAPRGRITGLIGPNGAGKTTIFNVCCGFQTADEGRVTFDGADITKHDASARARLGMGRTFQRMELFRSLTVRENIELGVESLHVTGDPLSQLGLLRAGRKIRREIAEETDHLLELTGLGPVANKRAGEISTGHGRLLEVARALARKPTLLLLDEPSSGLDAKESATFGELLSQLVEDTKLGILMIEHDMSLVLKICAWIFVLDFGKPLMAGTAADIRDSEAVRDAYLGKEVA